MKQFQTLLLLAALGAGRISAQPDQRGQLDTSPSLFAVLTAIQAAGLAPDWQSSLNHPLRAGIQAYIEKKKPPVLAELKTFHERHPNANISNYISLGLAVEGPPLFRIPKTMKEPPPDAVLLEAFLPLVAKLWAEADLEQVWKQIQPEYEKVIEQQYHAQVTQEVLRANAFLRNPTSGFNNRRFQIYVELTAPPMQVHTRSFGDEFFVVVTPATDAPIADIRRAYLYYLLDPLSIRFAAKVKEKSGLLQFAQAAPALDAHYKEDFYLLTTASLVRAIDARLSPVRGDVKMAMVDQSLREGFLLTPFFFDQMPAYEAQERALRLYYPDMIAAIDLKKEDKRLERVQWAEKKQEKVVRVTNEVKLTGVLKTLEDAEDLYNQKQYPKAKEKFSDALRETDSRRLHAKAYFGLARIAAHGREFELSEKLFEKALELDPDAEIRSWCLVYLGRLNFAVNEIDTAIEKFKAAAAVEGVPKGARDAAEKGLQEATAKKSKQPQ